VFTLLLAIPGLCAAPDGVLHYASGTTVDGTVALDGMHILSGQHLRTPAGRLSELLTRGSTLRLLGGTNLEFDGDSANLIEGGVALNTANQFVVRCGCASVIPSNAAKARYLVQLEQKTVFVTAEEAEVSVKSRKKSKTVPAGKTVAVLCGTAAQDIVFAGGNIPVNVMAGSVAASAVAGPVLNWKLNVSAASPDR